LSRHRYLAIATVAAAIGGVGVSAVASSASAASAHSASAAAVKLESVNVMGHGKHPLLVTSSGHAIYLLTGDSPKSPKCTSSACLGNWPAVTSTAKKPMLGKGIKGKLTVWTHGKIHQLVLNGHPLYTFIEDSSAGSANGQGQKSFGGTWDLMTAGSAAYTSSKGSGSGGSSAGGGWS
jgi:predicted lipoprotein with Yx(FWY)xxD motif